MAGFGRAWLVSRSRRPPSSLISYSTRCGREALRRKREMESATPMKIAVSRRVSRVAAKVMMMTMASSRVELRQIRMFFHLISEMAIPTTRAARVALGMFSTMWSLMRM